MHMDRFHHNHLIELENISGSRNHFGNRLAQVSIARGTLICNGEVCQSQMSASGGGRGRDEAA
jgi:hypothetical protein